jgi:hypothetical protein
MVLCYLLYAAVVDKITAAVSYVGNQGAASADYGGYKCGAHAAEVFVGSRFFTNRPVRLVYHIADYFIRVIEADQPVRKSADKAVHRHGACNVAGLGPPHPVADQGGRYLLAAYSVKRHYGEGVLIVGSDLACIRKTPVFQSQLRLHVCLSALPSF